MKQSNSLEIANLAQQVLQQHPNNHTFFSNQNIRHHLHQFEDAANCKLTDKLLIDFYNATHATLESFQSLIEVQRKIDECNRRLEELKAQLSDSESASTAYLESDVEFRLSCLQQTDENFKQNENYTELSQQYHNHQENLKKIEHLKASLAEIENSEEYKQNLMCMENFESEIKKAQDDLTKIFHQVYLAKGKKMADLLEDFKFSIITFLALAGVAALSYFVPAVFAGISAVIAGGIPFLIIIFLTVFVALFCGANAASNMSPSPSNMEDTAKAFYAASLYIGVKTYEGVYIAAPYIGFALAAFSLIPLVLSIKSGIQAVMLKYNSEDYFKQQIQEKIEQHLSGKELSLSAQ